MTNRNEEHLTQESRPTPGEQPAVAITRLRRQGFTVKQAAAAIGVSERQAYRVLQQLGDRPLVFERWSPSLAREQDSPEKIEWLFTTSIDGGWWTDDADIAWALHCADSELDPAVIKAFCRLYVAAQYADPVDAGNRRMIIDHALWHRVWESDEQLNEFVDTIPVSTTEEMDFAAEVTYYLSRYRTIDTDSEDRPTLKVRTIIKGVDDRQEYFNQAIEHLTEAERRRAKEAPPGVVGFSETPGENRRRR